MSWGERTCVFFAHCCPCEPTVSTCNPACPHYAKDEAYLARVKAVDVLAKETGGGAASATTLLDRTGAKAKEVDL